MASVYKPPLCREKEKKTPSARRHLSPRPPRSPLPPLSPPLPRLPPRCAPARHFRTTPLPGEGARWTRDNRAEGSARRRHSAPDGTPHARAKMPPPALKGAHKTALPRARRAPGPRECGPRPAGRGHRGALHLGVGARGGREATPRRLWSKRLPPRPLEQPLRGWPWLLRLWTRGRSPGNEDKSCRRSGLNI